MGQNLSNINAKLIEFEKTDSIPPTTEKILSGSDTNDINVFLFSKNSIDTTTCTTESNYDNLITNSEKQLIQNIQNQLYLLTNINELKKLNNEIHATLIKDIFLPMVTDSRQAINDIKATFEKQEQLQISLTKKVEGEKNVDQDIFIQTSVDSSSENTDNHDDQESEFDKQMKKEADIQDQQVFHLATDSFSSILLLLIKSAEKHDPSTVHQVLILTNQLYENIPMKYLSTINNKNNFLFKSLISLTNYVNQLPLSNDIIIKKETIQILLSFAIAKGSFKDILPILKQLIFNTIDVFNVRNLFIQLNNGLTAATKKLENEQLKRVTEQINEADSQSNSNSDQKHDKKEDTNFKQIIDDLTSIPLNYLGSIGAYPNTQVVKLDEKEFTGPFISSVILAHIDFDNSINAIKQFECGSINSSISFDFDSNTFKQLFYIIEQLTIKEDLNSIDIHILTVSLKLLTTHLKYLCAIKPNITQSLLVKTMGKIKTKDLDLITFITDDDLQKCFEILSKLAFINNKKFEQTLICQQASKALIYVINQRFSLFTEKLSFFHKYIIENIHPIFVEELFIELKRNITLLNWIEVLCDNNQIAFTILYSFIDIVLNPSDNMNEEYIKRIEQILASFQQLLFIQLVPEFRIKNLIEETTSETDSSISIPIISLAAKFITYIFSKNIDKVPIIRKLFDPVLIGLCLMTDTEKLFNVSTIQPVFINILPLLAEYILENIKNNQVVNNHLYYMCWLLGKMSSIMITGLQQDTLEIKYIDKLKLFLFSGGCEKIIIDKNKSILNLFESNLAVYSQFKWTNQQSLSDYEFLMSIYNNIDQGAQLISKMKIYSKNKQYVLQKSIEQQANDACAAVFSVYIKHFRRINLAKYELTRTNDSKPHSKLLSIFEYASYVYVLFCTTKGQGGDCNELYKQIKINTLFLLSSIKENNLIPIIEIDLTLSEINEKKISKSQQKYSQWKKQKNTFRLIRNIFQVCIRLKKLMLAKKQIIQQKQDKEYLLHQIIDDYIYKTIILSTNENKNSESEEIIQCMLRQYERAITRLITYRFISTFIEKVLQMKNLTMLAVCLPYLRNTNLESTYLENIQTTNDDLKEEIGNSYYSIIKTILSYILQSTSIISIKNIFHLLNLCYQQNDIYRLYHDQFVEILFKTFVSFVEKSNHSISLTTKFMGYNWFRLYLFKLCENIEIEKQQGEFVFNKLILNELKQLKQDNNISDNKNNSLQNTAIGWFIQAKDILSTKSQIELCTNQLLMLLLRCVNSYVYVRNYCSTIDYIEEFLYIYHNSQNNITILLTLKILRHVLPLLPENTNEKSKILMTNLFDNILYSIGDSLTSEKQTPEITTELIYIYRTIISVTSPWQIIATEFIFDNILLKSFENIEPKQMNYLLASLCILGGYIYPYCLSSIVQVYPDDEINNETQLAIIIDIDKNSLDSDSIDSLPYLIQYSQTNQIRKINANKLRIEIDVPPPNIFTLSNVNEILNTLISFIEIDTSTTKSLVLLQLKRRSISALYRLLNNKKLIDIFIQKSYASNIAKLSTLDLLSKMNKQPIDLRLSNKQHLEQYCLSLDRYEQSKQIIINKDNTVFIQWNDNIIKQDQLTIDLLSKDHQWKSNSSKRDIELFKQGRIGNDDIQIVPMPSTISNTWFLEECGTKHQFSGRIYLISENDNVSMATFILDNLRLSEGKWYFCVRLLEGADVQIGWATTGFTPTNAIGIGNDKYSWSYNGSKNKLYNNEEYSFLSEDIHWNTNDVCGCGIEISDDSIQINYWLNGHLFGTAFKHQSTISTTTTKCNMLPNGYGATYFPGVTLKGSAYSMSCCELIFHPEDMFECPLPKGYKPLLLPKLVNIDHAFVAYPCNAYLIGDNIQDYIYMKRNEKMKNFLRDFVNKNHLENLFNFDNHQLILPKESNGFPLIIDHHESLTISFDFEILSNFENSDIILLTSDEFSVRIPSNKITKETRIAIIFDLNIQQTIVYINNEYLIYENSIITKFDLSILPHISVGIKNLGIWKYAISQEHIRRLFNYGLFYVAIDYHRFKDYRKQINTFTFNEPFDENKWENVKIQMDNDESIDEINQLFGNKSYLVLDKSIDPWFEYTFILDIFIENYPKINEQITLVTLNNSQLEIYITDHGQICLSTGIKSESILKLNEYIRLIISTEKKSIKIYANGLLVLDGNVDDDDQWMIKDKRIDLFRETDLTKNMMSEDTLRIKCKSITYLNRSTNIIDEKMKSSEYSLDTLIIPPFSIIAPSLLLIGYDELSIKSVMKENPTDNIQLLDTHLREKTNVEERPKLKENLLAKLNPLIDQEKLKNFSEFDTDESIDKLSEIILVHRNDIQTSLFINVTDKDEKTSSNKKWFSQAVHHLNINDKLSDWIRDRSMIVDAADLTYQLFDLNKSVQEQTINIGNQQKTIQKSIQYSHRQLTYQQYCQSRIACENELISIYAHYIILNMLRIWSNDGSNLFPLETFGNWTFIVTLLKLLDYHYTYTRLNTDESIDRMSLLTNSILKVEINELLKHHTTTNNQITSEILQHKAPLLYQLQKDFIIQWIQFSLNPSNIFYDYNNETIIIDKQSIIKQPNFNFILKIFNIL